ncbi:hypothetical protein ACFSHQ_09535 [Gemmobacter lanyuensis]
MLHLIRSRHGPALALEVAASFVTTARPAEEPQITAARPDPRLDPGSLAPSRGWRRGSTPRNRS